MGYGLQGYMLKTAQVRGNFNNWPERSFDHVYGNFKHQMDKLNAHFEDELKDLDCPNAQASLERIIFGNISNIKNGFIYCYVLEYICATYGKAMNNSKLYPLGGIRNIDFLDPWTNTPFNIPVADDFPIVYTLLFNDLETVKRALSNSILEADGKAQFAAWLSAAQSAKSDLILFYY